MSATTPDVIWQNTLSTLKEKINKATYETWFRPTKALALHDNKLTIEIPNQFFVQWVDERYLPLIKRTVAEIAGRPLELEYKVAPSSESMNHVVQHVSEPRPPSPASRSSLATVDSRLNERYTFDSFVVGKSNQFAHAASKAVAESPAKIYNPLFIYGGVGLGKTHIMHAIGNEVKHHEKNKSVVYVSSEHFTNELIYSIQHGETLRFREKYRNIDLLFIDDIQFLAGKEGTQEEFFHTFNTLYDAQKQIVVTSDRPPKEIPTLEERLVSRFEWGLVTDIQPPDLETRIAILNKKADRDGVSLPYDVTQFIANNITSNIRELEGALIRLLAFASLSNREVNLEVAREVLSEITNNNIKQVTCDLIINKVCEHYKVNEDDMLSKKRTNAIAFPRQVAMYLSRQLTDLSLMDIGRSFGGRDHTTVMHAIEKISEKIKNDVEFRMHVTDLSNYISG